MNATNEPLDPSIYAPNGKRLWFSVPSFTNPDDPDKGYIVKRDANGNWSCSCPASIYRQHEVCKHRKMLNEEGLLW